MSTETTLQAMVIAYMQCALWSSTDEDGEPLDGLYETWDLSDKAEASMIEDCENFLNAVEDSDVDWRSGWSAEQMGHDLWLTRNGHGAGFWDRYYGGDLYEVGQRLTLAAKAYGSSDVYVGDDGKLHVT
jgi:hypothetical protein